MEQNMKQRWGENGNASINYTMKLSFIKEKCFTKYTIFILNIFIQLIMVFM